MTGQNTPRTLVAASWPGTLGEQPVTLRLSKTRTTGAMFLGAAREDRITRDEVETSLSILDLGVCAQERQSIIDAYGGMDVGIDLGLRINLLEQRTRPGGQAQCPMGATDRPPTPALFIRRRSVPGASCRGHMHGPCRENPCHRPDRGSDPPMCRGCATPVHHRSSSSSKPNREQKCRHSAPDQHCHGWHREDR